MRRIASSIGTPDTLLMCCTSDAPREWMASCGYADFTAENIAS